MEEGKNEPEPTSKTVKFSAEEVQAVANLHLLLYDREGEVAGLWKSTDFGSTKEFYALAAYLARPMDPIPGKNQYYSW